MRIAGVAALRDAGAMARALRPLGKRRPSRRFFQLDETATAEHLAEHQVLVPQFVGRPERWFAATLLVEELPALPLWRGLAGEFETLLARQGGFRSFRRFGLAQHDGRLRLRSRSGAWFDPQVLNGDDASLVLLATDGTTGAWADGSMASLLGQIGRHASLAVVQWMPERRWPHTALGAAEAQVWLPRAGAYNIELGMSRPRWLAADQAIVAVPLVALNPGSFARLASMLMAKPGVRGSAALLWPDADPDDATQSDDAEAAITASERIARFRSIASARVLQCAVQLSAAAPLTLSVVRLVHHVMQPDAPAEDLPLLLLGGLLDRKASAPPAGTDAVEDDSDADEEVEFEFAPGVRELLQRSLTRSEALAVGRAVSQYIAARSDSPLDFSALIVDPLGPLKLPHWARPFAEVTRQVRELFAPPPSVTARTVTEVAWAPGVTVQAEVALQAFEVRQIAWSRDAQRLAVLHEYGLQVFRLAVAGPGRRHWLREPLAMQQPLRLMFVKGFDIAEHAAEALIGSFRAGWADHFRGDLEPLYHTVSARHPRPRFDVDSLTKLVKEKRAMLCCIGGNEFFRSKWASEATPQWSVHFDLTAPPLLLQLIADDADTGVGHWRIRAWPPGPEMASLRGDPASVAGVLLRLLQDLGARAIPQLAFGANACTIAWDHRDRLLVADSARLGIVVEESLELLHSFPESLPAGIWPRLAAHPSRPLVAVASIGSVHVLEAGRRPRGMHLGDGQREIAALTWSPDGSKLAARDDSGLGALIRIGETDIGLELVDADPLTAGPVWSPAGSLRTCATEGGDVIAEGEGFALPLLAVQGSPESMSWSHDDGLFACALPGGRIMLVDDPAADLPRTIAVQIPQPASGGRTDLAFAPRRLDSGFEALVVSNGSTLTLLRLQPDAFDASADSASQQAPEVQPARTEPWASADAVTDAAIDTLRAMAVAFHVGQLSTTDGGSGVAKPSRRYAELTDIDEASGQFAALEHVVASSEGLFADSFKQALRSRHDPLADPDLEPARARWAGACHEVGEALAAAEHGVASPADLAERIERLNRMLPDSADEASASADSPRHPARQVFDTLIEALRADDKKTRHDPTALIREANAMLRELQDPVRSEPIVARAARLDWLSSTRGGAEKTPFGQCVDLPDYVDRFVQQWLDYCRRIAFRDFYGERSARKELTIEFQTPVASLDIVNELARPLGVRIDSVASGFESGRVAWTTTLGDYVELLQLLGRIVATAVAYSLGGPVPVEWGVPGHTVLWVDDKPANNDRERLNLVRRGFRVLLADSTDAALELLAGQHVDAVISDMSRPGDRSAGRSLLDAMRERNHRQPVALYTTPTMIGETKQADQSDFAVVAHQFHQIEGFLHQFFVANRGVA